MLLGIVSFIFCVGGIIGYYIGVPSLMYVGLVLTIIEMIVGFVTGQLRSSLSIWLGIFFAIGASVSKKAGFFEALAIFMCYENVIMFIAGLVMMLFAPKNSNIDDRGTRTTYGELGLPGPKKKE